MEKSLKEDMNRVYTLFSGEKIAVDTYSTQVVLHHLLDGLLYSSVYTLDQKQIWSCEHTEKVSLAEYCQNHILEKEEIRWIYGGILENLMEIQDFLLDANCLYLDASEIYLDASEKRVWNSYVPFYQESVWKNLQELTQYLLGNLEQEDTESVQVLYGIFHYLTQGGMDIDKIWKMLCGKISDEKKRKEEEAHRDFGQTEKVEYASQELRDYIAKENERIEKIRNNRIRANEIEIRENRVRGNNIQKVFGKSDGEKRLSSSFSYGRWVVASLPILLAIFICVFVTLNEWYLSNQRKILLLVLAVILGGVGVLLWRVWGKSLKKENLMEDGEGVNQATSKWDENTEVLSAVFQKKKEPVCAWLVRKETRESVPVSETPTVIGKSPEKAQILIQEPTVSRIHAKISMRNDAYYLEDLNSKNGTYVNGKRLKSQKPVRLCGDDVLVFANICYYFQLSNR